MRSTARAFLLLLGATLTLPAVVAAYAGQTVPPSPARVSSTAVNEDLWVSTRELTGPDGWLLPQAHVRGRWAVSVLAELRSNVERLRKLGVEARAAHPCMEGITSPTRPDQGLSGYRDLAQQAKVVISGTVVGVDAGLFAGSPGLLLQVSVADWMKDDADYPQSDIVYVYYPAGDFVIAGVSVCVRSDNWPVVPPAVGDQILIFPRRPPVAVMDGSPWASLGGYGLIFESSGGGGVHAPRQLMADVPELKEQQTLARLVREARRAIRDR